MKIAPRLHGSGVALSLGSSFRGYYTHCGFLSEFSTADIQPDRIAGASSGAIAGLLYAMGYRGEALIEFITQKGLTRSFLDWGVLLRVPGVVTHMHGTGFFTADGAVQFFKDRLGMVQLESLKNPRLEIAVTDLRSRKSLMVAEGDAIDHVIASCMVPGLFRARAVNDRLLWDGGLANDVPFHHWIEDPDIHTIVLHSIRQEDKSFLAPRVTKHGPRYCRDPSNRHR